MKNFLTYLAVVFILMTLTSAKPIKTKQKEAIIIGRLVIDSQSELSTENITICFQNNTKGHKKVKINEDGLFCTKIGINYSFVDYIQYKNEGDFRKILFENCLTFNLSEDNKVYNLGDIQIKWSPSDRDKIKKGFSLGFGMGGAHMGGGVAIPISSAYSPDQDCPAITVFENDSIISWYKKNYPNDEREIINEYIKVLEN